MLNVHRKRVECVENPVARIDQRPRMEYTRPSRDGTEYPAEPPRIGDDPLATVQPVRCYSLNSSMPTPMGNNTTGNENHSVDESLIERHERGCESVNNTCAVTSTRKSVKWWDQLTDSSNESDVWKPPPSGENNSSSMRSCLRKSETTQDKTTSRSRGGGNNGKLGKSLKPQRRMTISNDRRRMSIVSNSSRRDRKRASIYKNALEYGNEQQADAEFRLQGANSSATYGRLFESESSRKFKKFRKLKPKLMKFVLAEMKRNQEDANVNVNVVKYIESDVGQTKKSYENIYEKYNIINYRNRGVNRSERRKTVFDVATLFNRPHAWRDVVKNQPVASCEVRKNAKADSTDYNYQDVLNVFMPVLYHEPFDRNKPWTYINRYPNQYRPSIDHNFKIGLADRYVPGKELQLSRATYFGEIPESESFVDAKPSADLVRKLRFSFRASSLHSGRNKQDHNPASKLTTYTFKPGVNIIRMQDRPVIDGRRSYFAQDKADEVNFYGQISSLKR